MNTYAEYEKAFLETFAIEKEELTTLEYQKITAWDSVGHMMLIAAIENKFEILLDTDDIVDFNSFQKGKEILASKYKIIF